MVALNIACLFNGAGLAMHGLELAGHECTGYEIEPAKNHLAKLLVKGECILADVRDVDLSGFDAVWASPPCQDFSELNPKAQGDSGLLEWSLALPHRVLWVENVAGRKVPEFGRLYNTAQFEAIPRQIRTRQIGGRYLAPAVFRGYKKSYLPDWDICPAIIATEYKNRYSWGFGSKLRPRSRAAEWYDRPLNVREAAYHQGLEIPDGLLKSWFQVPDLENPQTGKRYTWPQWREVLFEAVGNGVPPYMTYAFGIAYSQGIGGEEWVQSSMFEVS